MHDNIESHQVEKRIFKPPGNFAKNARIKSLAQYRRMYRESIHQPAKFWAREASELAWRARWKKVLVSSFTSRIFLRPRLPCSPARGSARCIQWSSADLVPSAFEIALPIAARSQSSQPTERIAGAALCH